MKVGELIFKLQEIADDTLDVYVAGYEYGVDHLTSIRRVHADPTDGEVSWWAGSYRLEVGPDNGIYLHGKHSPE